MKQIELTLAIIKPHAVQHVIGLHYIQNQIKREFRIVARRRLVFSKEIAEEFYAEHRSKFFYNRLISFITSGPSVAFVLAGENAVAKWREMMGPTKISQAVYSHPDSIRGLFGLSDTRNACHGSDAEESARREIKILFPDLDIDEWRRKQLKKKSK